MFSEDDIRQIAEIDERNMAAMIRDRGEVYDAAKRMRDVVTEMEKRVRFLLVRRGTVVVGYISMKVVGYELWIKSIQVDKDFSKIVLRELIRATIAVTQDVSCTMVRSKVFTNNEPSRNFHVKLGFALIEIKDGICYYRADIGVLIHRLASYR